LRETLINFEELLYWARQVLNEPCHVILNLRSSKNQKLRLHVSNNNRWLIKLLQSLTEKPFLYVNNLRALSLAGNRIEYVSSGAFDGLDRLVSLALNDNRITLIPDNLFSNMENLTQLLLHNNSIQYVWPRTFAGLRSLTRLQLAGNRLGQLPDGMLRQSPHLRHLDLDGNQLKTIGRCALPMPPRRTAQTGTVAPPRASPSGRGGARTSTATSGPTATALPAEVVGSRLKFLSLIGNPMICDCQLTWLVEFQQQTTGSSGSSQWPTGLLWPTIRGTCRDSRQSIAAPESRLRHSSSPFFDGAAVGGSSKTSQVAAEWTPSLSVELNHAVDHGVSSIVGRCSQLASSCAKEQLQQTSDCHYE
jgi:hypothetical protein